MLRSSVRRLGFKIWKPETVRLGETGFVEGGFYRKQSSVKGLTTVPEWDQQVRCPNAIDRLQFGL